MEIDRLIRKYREKGVIVDACLLVLYVVGLYDPRLIQHYNRTRQFMPDDFDLLKLLLEEFRRHVTTPNILTEASNLVGRLDPDGRRGLRERLADVIDQGQEQYVRSDRISRKESFLRLGLTDAGILEEVGRGHLLLTIDLKLRVAAQTRGMDVLNFEHWRWWWRSRE